VIIGAIRDITTAFAAVAQTIPVAVRFTVRRHAIANPILFLVTPVVTAIASHAIVVVAVFTGVDDAIAAGRHCAGRATSVNRRVGVVDAIVAFFVGVQHAVAAARKRAVGATRVRYGIGVLIGVIAGFFGVDYAVAAGRQYAAGTTSIGHRVGVCRPFVASF